MPQRCIAANCSNTHTADIKLYHFPKEQPLREQWIAQVRRTQLNWPGPTATSVLCSEHFVVVVLTGQLV